jgi:hypothetical protein
MTQWRKDGRPLSDDDLAELAMSDGQAVCEFAGAAFRFTASTVPARRPGRRRGGTVVLSLRQLGAARAEDAVDVVDYVDVNQFDSTSCTDECPLLDAAGETASRATRRYIAVELFHSVEELLGGIRAA